MFGTACGDDAAPADPTEIDAGMLDASMPVDGMPADGMPADGMPADGDAGKPVSYQDDVSPIFQRCVICHRANSIIDLDLANPFDSKSGIINRTNTWAVEHESEYDVVVRPGKPDESFLIYKVEEDPNPATFDVTNNGDPMPLQIPRVTASELADIKQWIRDGAKNDAFFTDRVATVLGSEVTLGRRRGKCTYCHYPGSSTGLDITAPFDTQKGLVGAESFLSDKLRVKAGSPDESFLVEKIEQANPSAGAQMPLHPARLTDGEVDILRRWIAQGATRD